ncbi:phosphate/phosphite/phosphonate ABC transporter substrate-binding protein [Halalkalibacillus sediminis]|uniref:Phosphate/phosphite/phosphonate ABC transporter substrate-binding protein n=1 Tax=Halalkalibacillus sediminis TaxID=2018042 RepID=A0A2I0QVL3_9BACI|nr:phosphate/phosphite/phosphonate ABC transporter substrate-binding protein [Halalkalibacillus sediminis]PKR78329.1 phosphate/phosphite/phosphonate ABC transporter substrate-binding protein [Halalkalibacillus sediminis]
MKKFLLLTVAALLLTVLAACGGSDDEGNGDGGEEGSERPDELVMGFVPSQESDTIAETVEPLADRLGEELGIEVSGQVMTNYNALIEGMGAGQIHIGFVPAFGYVLANQEYDVEVILKSIRYGSSTYKAQYVVRSDSDIEELADLEGKVWAFPDQTSTSGFLFPASQLMEKFDIESTEALQTEFFSNSTQAGGHDTAAIAVYEGDADVATTFDDARGELEEEYPDVMDKLKVIGYTDEIPNDTISVIPELEDEFVQEIKDVFLSFNDDEEMIEIMNEVYNWDAIDEAEHSEYKVVEETYKKFQDDISLD